MMPRLSKVFPLTMIFFLLCRMPETAAVGAPAWKPAWPCSDAPASKVQLPETATVGAPAWKPVRPNSDAPAMEWPVQFKSERYMVRRSMYRKIVNHLGLEDNEPEVDMFADPELHQLPRWFGPGGVCKDAFSTSWDFEIMGLGWANPPFSRLQEVIDKIVHDGCRCVLVVPMWPTCGWYDDVQPYIMKKFYIAAGQKVFHDGKGLVPPTKWPLWAYVVDGRQGNPQGVFRQGHPRAEGEYRRKFKEVTFA